MLSNEDLVRTAMGAMAKVFPEAETGIEDALSEIAAGDNEAIAMVAALRAVAEAAVKAEREAHEPVAWMSPAGGLYYRCASSKDRPLYTTPPAAPVPEQASAAVPDVDWLAQVIRAVDGSHSLGAGVLAEKIVEAMLATAVPKEPFGYVDSHPNHGHEFSKTKQALYPADIAEGWVQIAVYTRKMETKS